METIKEVEVRVPKYVDKHVDRTLVRPIENKTVEVEVPFHKEYLVDKFVEKRREIDVPIYVEKEY